MKAKKSENEEDKIMSPRRSSRIRRPPIRFDESRLLIEESEKDPIEP